ncbi:thiamine pyrophosphate-binding protein [bacterium]|nr:thiamine pyrophosphate-binding protein [bacterium]
MKKTGAQLAAHALEQLPVTHTFGIPGVHVTELYDELNKSKKISPTLVTHEGGAAFMADAMSRTSASIGTLVIVPAAGVTHALSGIGEAFLDGIPMLIISGGVNRNSGKAYQLHQWDQQQLMKSVTKHSFLVESHKDVVPTIYEAYRIAVSGEPGPVFVEIPYDVQIFQGETDRLPTFEDDVQQPQADVDRVQQALSLLRQAQKPGLFLGWGAKDCTALSVRLAELLEAPVATTLQGLSVFPADHPLHTGMGFGRHSVPAAENAFAGCDCLLAVATRFSEIPTGSYGVEVPANLIHIDINPEVFDQNYPTAVAIEADAGNALRALIEALEQSEHTSNREVGPLRKSIAADKQSYLQEWREHLNERVNPALFFEALRSQIDDDAITVVDDGNHTYLTAELFPVLKSRHLICPTDFNCMGYAVPAAIGAKLANPQKQVVGIVGDGGFLMTCMEILTAATENLGVVYFVFYDGELSQIAQGQEIPYNRKTCTMLGKIGLDGVALATGAAYLKIDDNEQIATVIAEALKTAAENQPVIVDVRIDYSKRTRFTQGVVKTVLKRFPLGDKMRFIGRAFLRKVTG